MGEEQLQALVGRRQISSAQLVIEWTPTTLEGIGDLINSLSKKLRALYPEEIYGAVPAPAKVLRSRANQVAQIAPNQIQLNTEFAADHSKKPAAAAQWMKKNWLPVLELIIKRGLKPNFLALVWDINFSTAGLEIDEHRFATRYFRIPPGFTAIENADFRIAEVLEDRYFLNWGVSPFQRLTVSMVVTPGGLVSSETKVEDHGLRLRLDLNTKVNVIRQLPPIEVTERDFAKLCGHLQSTVDERVDLFILDAGKP